MKDDAIVEERDKEIREEQNYCAQRNKKQLFINGGVYLGKEGSARGPR